MSVHNIHPGDLLIIDFSTKLRLECTNTPRTGCMSRIPQDGTTRGRGRFLAFVFSVICDACHRDEGANLGTNSEDNTQYAAVFSEGLTFMISIREYDFAYSVAKVC